MNLWLGTAASYCESLTGSQAIKRYGSSGDRKKPSSSAHPACSRQPLALSLESKSRRARRKTPRISAPVSLNSPQYNPRIIPRPQQTLQSRLAGDGFARSEHPVHVAGARAEWLHSSQAPMRMLKADASSVSCLRWAALPLLAHLSAALGLVFCA